MADIARRFRENPLLMPADIRPSASGLTVECVLNPGVFRFDGKVWLLLRVAERPRQKPGTISLAMLDPASGVRLIEFDKDDPALDQTDPRVLRHSSADYLTTLSHLRLMSSVDGVRFSEDPTYPPIVGQGELECYGIEDGRVVQIGNTYHLTYTQVSPHGVGVGLRSTKDWRTFVRHGMIFPPHNKDCALFGETIDGHYYALHRPSSPELGGNYIWIARSPDLLHWGNHRCIVHTRQGLWDSARIGAGAAPIRTAQGWLEIYHGADDQNRYCLGALLLELQRPWNVLARSREPIMEPLAECEKAGFFGNTVFTNGHVVDGDQLTLYYGAADSVVCGAVFSIDQILCTLI